MGAAFENARILLKLADRSDPLNEIITMEVVALAACGEHDAERLCASVLATHKPAAEYSRGDQYSTG
jgi:hypothetical protein